MKFENTDSWSIEKLIRKSDQHWDMAGLARQDRDMKDAERHTAIAREYLRRAGERKREQGA
jgi:hypothetical protein